MKETVAQGRYAAIDYLRAFITLLVLAHHSALSYLDYAYVNPSTPLRSSAPIVDSSRWIFFDHAVEFNDIFFMSLMFLISGLFVLPALRSKGVIPFIKDRFLRLGLPFVVGVVFVIPVAYYPAWLATGRASNYFQFWFDFITQYGWAPGPLWFIWVLLAFDLIAAILYPVLCKLATRLIGKSSIKVFLALFLVSFLTWIPMIIVFGRQTWVPFITVPFWFQLPRIALYLSWFLCGAILGATCLAQGFLSGNSRFAKSWPIWIALAFTVFICFRFATNMISGFPGAETVRELSKGALATLSCCASSFAFLSLFLGTIKARSRIFDSLARNAYLMYAVHYVFVLWTQFLLLKVPVSAATKFTVVFLITVFASWGFSSLLRRVPAIRKIA